MFYENRSRVRLHFLCAEAKKAVILVLKQFVQNAKRTETKGSSAFAGMGGLRCTYKKGEALWV